MALIKLDCDADFYGAVCRKDCKELSDLKARADEDAARNSQLRVELEQVKRVANDLAQLAAQLQKERDGYATVCASFDQLVERVCDADNFGRKDEFDLALSALADFSDNWHLGPDL